MVGLGVLMAAGRACGACGCAGAAGSTTSRWLLRAGAVLMGPSGFVAVLAGWITTEVGRQPFTVYGLLRTADSRSRRSTLPAVGASLVAFVVVYFVVFGAGMLYILRLMAQAAASSTSPNDRRACRCAPPASRPPPGACRQPQADVSR